LDILAQDGWDAEKFSKDKLTYVYNCATLYPRFEVDFVSQADLARWRWGYDGCWRWSIGSVMGPREDVKSGGP
jgi:hypothetical protein